MVINALPAQAVKLVEKWYFDVVTFVETKLGSLSPVIFCVSFIICSAYICHVEYNISFCHHLILLVFNSYMLLAFGKETNLLLILLNCEVL